jgi:hypothetical protein
MMLSELLESNALSSSEKSTLKAMKTKFEKRAVAIANLKALKPNPNANWRTPSDLAHQVIDYYIHNADDDI